MTKYLYGANVKAVQKFIFQTNKLKEIIGASELVEQICTSMFEEQVGKTHYISANCIIAAAGIIKYIFEDETECQSLVRVFPKSVFNAAPGIVFSQAVVQMAGGQPTGEELKELEQRLKTQRNKAVSPLETGLRITERSRRTGLPGVVFESEEALDQATKLKKKANKEGKESLGKKLYPEGVRYLFPSDIKEIASKKNYLAIIHADGNNLGKAIRNLNEDQAGLNNHEKSSTERNRDFSLAIEAATLAAAKTAITSTFKEIIVKSEDSDGQTVTLPMRPVLLGGDDFTVICNAEYALELTTVFLTEFEKESALAFQSKDLNLPALTACAGIAYIKTNYPFHYGAKLAEDLCGFSKNVAKQEQPDQVPACLTFHRVQSSFVGEYSDLIERELAAPATGLSFCGGPYFISQNPTIEELMAQVKWLRNKDTPGSKLREWISTCHLSKSIAIEDLERIIEVLEGKKKQNIIAGLGLESLLKNIKERKEEETIKTTLYDAITIHSLNSKI